MNRKLYCVTGGSGFIGTALVKRLVASGYRVRVLDNSFRSSKARLAGIINSIEFVEGSVCDEQTVVEFVEGGSVVIHLAAINGTENFYKHPELVLDVGVRGILNVMTACKKHKIPDLLVASSSEAYQTPDKVPTDEAVALSIPDVLNPRYSYGGSKILTELVAINYGRTDLNRVMVFRPHNVYGPDMGFEHVLPQFIIRALKTIEQYPEGAVPFQIHGDGSETRAFTYVDDMIDGIMLLLDKGKHLNIYHVGNPEELAISDIAQRVMRYFGRDVELIKGELTQGSTKRRCPDISKMKILGFVPKISFDRGLPYIADWYADYYRSGDFV